MKELRFSWNGQVWRVAFAFDPQRQAIVLVGGDKGGADQRRFYKRLLTVAVKGSMRTTARAPTALAKRWTVRMDGVPLPL
jgi:hypothetical protein